MMIAIRYSQRMAWRCARLCILPLLFLVPLVAQTVAPGDVTVTPSLVIVGAPEVVRVHAAQATAVEGEWLGRKIDFFSGGGGEWVALAGVDVQAPEGPSTLHLRIKLRNGWSEVNTEVEVHAAHYRTGTLMVAPKFVEPGQAEMREIEAEIKLKREVFAHSAPEPLWHGDFQAPVRTAPTDSFGTRRMFNGKLASIHKGADFHAAVGTPVRASNSGVVVLARRLYFEGNCVVVDHGLGLYTESMHFSRIDVHEGEHVRKGQLLGLSGATGRVTGPHLHWAVRWQGAYLDPVKLLRLNLASLP
jgi:murein DD-endopeptidase MepM/ murein hydrolase activator NlpD